MQPCSYTSTTGAEKPLRTAAHSFCIELKHIMSAPTLLTDCAHLCLLAPAVRQWVLLSPWKAPLHPGCVFSSLPMAFTICPLPTPWSAEEAPLLPPTFNKSPLLCVVFLACKLPRLICCDRSNLLGKAEVLSESSSPSSPKPRQSFHSMTLNATVKASLLKRQQRFTDKSKNSDRSATAFTSVKLHLLKLEVRFIFEL